MPDTLETELVTAQLERILTSPPLESSPSLCRFLKYVVEETLAGRIGSLKEYSLGVVAFERGDEFDPRMDPIVRVQARNLRVRLGQYYAGAGANDPILIDLPKRTYVPVFRTRAEETPEPEGVTAPTPVAPLTNALSAPADALIVTTGAVADPAAPAARSWRRPAWLSAVALLLVLGGRHSDNYVGLPSGTPIREWTLGAAPPSETDSLINTSISRS